MKTKKTVFIATKITPQLKERLDKAIDVVPEMEVSSYIRYALENQIKKDLKE